MIANEVNSSMIEPSLNLLILKEVKTTKHKPNSVAEVFKICGMFFLCFSFSPESIALSKHRLVRFAVLLLVLTRLFR